MDQVDETGRGAHEASHLVVLTGPDFPHRGMLLRIERWQRKRGADDSPWTQHDRLSRRATPDVVRLVQNEWAFGSPRAAENRMARCKIGWQTLLPKSEGCLRLGTV